MDTAERSSPALLSLPPELRNVIFSYVYATAVPDHIILLRFKSGRAGVESNKAPPKKNSLLICRQVYNEMKGVQAVAYRRYWTVQKFLIIADRDTKKDLHLATKDDLQHVCRLAVHCYFPRPEKYTALISFRYNASGWRVTMESSRAQQAISSGRVAWYMIKCPDSIMFLRGLRSIIETLHEGHGASRNLNESTVDPWTGRGLDADEMHQLPFTVREFW